MLHRPPLALVLVVLATASGVGGCGRFGASIDEPASSSSATAPGQATVDEVVDGDTVRVRLPGRPGTESVRLIGIDTPETHGPGGLRECFGKEASARTAELLPEGEQVRLVRDVEARDRYGRLLAYVYRKRDDLFVNLALAEDGFATSLTIPPNVAHRDGFVAAVAEARDEGKGLWGRCGGPDKPL